MPATTQHRVRHVRPNVYVPTVTFFDPVTEDLDIPAFQKHVVWIGQAGADIVISGTNGEAAHLSHSDRSELVKAARQALDEAGLNDIIIITGGSSASTRETIQFCKEAAEAGADAVICLLASPFASTLKTSREALRSYYTDVSNASPLPIMIYNYPVASGGIDLDSDLIIELARTCPNICGAKLTCANMGSLHRIATATKNPSFIKQYPRSNQSPFPFWVGSGYSDFLFPAILGRASGCITGVGNVAPRVVALLYNESVRAVHTESLELMKSTQELQDLVSAADGALSGSGIPGTKYILSKHRGYGGIPRRPLQPYDTSKAEALEEALKPLLALEKSLSASVNVNGNGTANH